MTRYALSPWSLKVLGYALFFLANANASASTSAGAEPTAASTGSSSKAIVSVVAAAAPASYTTTPAVKLALSSSSSSSSSFSSSETCRSATVNYITHRLPQQCWAGSSSIAATATSRTDAPQDRTPIATAQKQSETAKISEPDSSKQGAGGAAESHSASSASQAQPTDGSSVSLSVATSSISSPSAAAEISQQPEPEPESPLDNAEFLSFEDWKKKKLAQAGEDANALLQERKKVLQDRQRPGIDNVLDTFGDDAEIAFDFNPFGGADRPGEQPGHAASRPSAAVERDANAGSQPPRKRSKDAGRTCKERSNYASLDCAAGVLKTNPKCKSPASILVENKDSYMLNTCATDNKFLIVELCETVLIDTVVLANFEFFSSMFRTFKVSGASKYPPKPDEWKHFGTFEARNSREIQAFLVESPIFAKYLRLEFLSHYGSEYYCPVSLLRVHGITMYEDYLHDEQGRESGDDEDENGAISIETGPESANGAVNGLSPIKEDSTAPSAAVTDEKGQSSAIAPPVPSSVSAGTKSPSETAQEGMCLSTAHPKPESVGFATPDKCAVDSTPPTPSTKTKVASTHPAPTSHVVESTVNHPKSVTPPASPTPVAAPPQSKALKNTSEPVTTASSNATDKITTSLEKSENQGASAPASSPTLTATSYSVHTAPAAPPAYQPPTQESFFKSIHKRLLALEANATLSLQYIESQSALLRDAFAKVEKRQLGKTSTFLETLNNTVTSELARFKGDYDQLWQSAVMELASQREEGRRERELLGERIKVLAEEMVNQKRLMAAQATLLLLCLGLVVFGKLGGVAPAMDSGLLQGMQEIVLKAKEAKLQQSEKDKAPWSYDSPWSTPSARQKEPLGFRQQQENVEPHLSEPPNYGDGQEIARVRTAGDEGKHSTLQPNGSHNAELLSVHSAPTTPTT